MKQEIDPKDTNRKEAFEHWMKSPMPMVTLTKTFNVTRLYELSKRKGYKFNMILCWCIAQAASKMEEFYLLPENGKLYKYDHLAINMIVNNIKGGLSFCDIASNDNLEEFNANYLYLTKTSMETCQDILDSEAVIVGTSALVGTELDSIVNQYSGIYNNPFMAWGRYRKGWFKTTLPISFQFHHVQMDGQQATRFLEELQNVINTL
ncbi:MAG: chloramphenicol acetyltransferase [Bacteroidaceae bacterium]|nr:chloramphenicol acetyltransferase [Bacteroidaceae bacterium]MBR1941054.1 chloramphenicol acetyltransferase [Bacteroidaceae bacterium]